MLETMHKALCELTNTDKNESYTPHITVARLISGAAKHYVNMFGDFKTSNLSFKEVEFSDRNRVKTGIELLEPSEAPEVEDANIEDASTLLAEFLQNYQKASVSEKAYARRSGNRVCVYQGNTGKELRCFSGSDAQAEADAYVQVLHERHNPSRRNRGESARRRNEEKADELFSEFIEAYEEKAGRKISTATASKLRTMLNQMQQTIDEILGDKASERLQDSKSDSGHDKDSDSGQELSLKDYIKAQAASLVEAGKQDTYGLDLKQAIVSAGNQTTAY